MKKITTILAIIITIALSAVLVAFAIGVVYGMFSVLGVPGAILGLFIVVLGSITLGSYIGAKKCPTAKQTQSAA